MPDTIEYNGVHYDSRHGGPFDRGSADSYYSREKNPHYFLGETYTTATVIPLPGSDEHAAYLAGYSWNEWNGNKKDWGTE